MPIMKEIQQPRFLAIDFYCGAGGTTRGLLDTGGYVIGGIDNDATCERTYTANNRNSALDGLRPRFLHYDMFPASPEYPDGQQNELAAELSELIPRYREMAAGAPLLFAICAPCQTFTKFVQRNLTDARQESRTRDKSLLAQTLPFIKEFEPELVMIENVVAMRRGASRGIWDDFLAELSGDYEVADDEVCTSNFGVPQRRKRLIGLAVRTGAPSALSRLRVPTCDPHAARQTVREAIGNLPPLKPGGVDETVPNHRCRNLSPLNRRRLAYLEPGQSNRRFADSEDNDLMLPCHRRLSASGTPGFGDVYTRMHPDRPSPTITTRFHSVSNGRYGHYDPSQVRAISLREGAALQSFPDSYEFHASGMDGAARMIGNAVPPKLAAFMASYLADACSAAVIGEFGDER